MCDAAAKNDVAMLRRLVASGIDPNMGDYDKRTPLHLAASNGCMDALCFLLSCHGIDPSPEDRYRGTPLQARRSGLVHIAGSAAVDRPVGRIAWHRMASHGIAMCARRGMRALQCVDATA